jgi:uncharacterized protein (DUF1330 family)
MELMKLGPRGVTPENDRGIRVHTEFASPTTWRDVYGVCSDRLAQNRHFGTEERETMSAYLIVNVDVEDAAAYEEYKAKAPALIRSHGGEYLVRGGKFVVLEGDWKPSRLVILRFPNIAAVQNLFNDPEYQPIKALRQRVSKTEIVAVEGL